MNKTENNKKRNELIAYSLITNGEYTEITKMIKAGMKLSPEQLAQASKVKNVITIFDQKYPKTLLELKYPPYVLYYKGDLSLLKNKNICGIAGSRLLKEDYQRYVYDSTKRLCYHFNGLQNVVVSGLAKGVDAIAHSFAQRSIGVIGCGIDYIYPSENEPLYHKLETSGLILSEYPGKTKPLAYHFPFRNRIIAGLCKKLYIPCIESAQSGTGVTINETLELQKEVYVLPMLATYDNYNNKLINDGAMVIDKSMLDMTDYSDMMPEIMFK